MGNYASIPGLLSQSVTLLYLFRVESVGEPRFLPKCMNSTKWSQRLSTTLQRAWKMVTPLVSGRSIVPQRFE